MELFGTAVSEGAGGRPVIHDIRHPPPSATRFVILSRSPIPRWISRRLGPAQAIGRDDLRLPDADELWPGRRPAGGKRREPPSRNRRRVPPPSGRLRRKWARRSPQPFSGPGSPESHGNQLTPVEHLQSPPSPIAPPVFPAAAAPERPAAVLAPSARVVPLPGASAQPPPESVASPVEAAAPALSTPTPVSPAPATLVPPSAPARPHVVPPAPGRDTPGAIASGQPATSEPPRSTALASPPSRRDSRPHRRWRHSPPPAGRVHTPCLQHSPSASRSRPWCCRWRATRSGPMCRRRSLSRLWLASTDCSVWQRPGGPRRSISRRPPVRRSGWTAKCRRSTARPFSDRTMSSRSS